MTSGTVHNAMTPTTNCPAWMFMVHHLMARETTGEVQFDDSGELQDHWGSWEAEQGNRDLHADQPLLCQPHESIDVV